MKLKHVVLTFLAASKGTASGTTKKAASPEKMDVDDDPDVLAAKMRDKLAGLERERAAAKARNEDTTFIDFQMEELRDFMEELENGLKEVLGGGGKGTKRDRAEADSGSNTKATAIAFVSRVGKSFKDWIKDNQDM